MLFFVKLSATRSTVASYKSLYRDYMQFCTCNGYAVESRDEYDRRRQKMGFYGKKWVPASQRDNGSSKRKRSRSSSPRRKRSSSSSGSRDRDRDRRRRNSRHRSRSPVSNTVHYPSSQPAVSYQGSPASPCFMAPSAMSGYGNPAYLPYGHIGSGSVFQHPLNLAHMQHYPVASPGPPPPHHVAHPPPHIAAMPYHCGHPVSAPQSVVYYTP